MRLELALSSLVVLGCGSKVAEEPRAGSPNEPSSATIERVSTPSPSVDGPTIEISHDASVLEEQRRMGGVAPDFYVEVPAKTIDPAVDQPARSVERFAVGGRPILWLAGDARQAVVDAESFSSLTVVDVTTLSAGERRIVGVASERARTMPPEELIEFLLHARILASYVHIGSEITRHAMVSEDTVFSAHYTGVHTFFTNEKVEQRFAFDVRVEADGTIAVIGSGPESAR